MGAAAPRRPATSGLEGRRKMPPPIVTFTMPAASPHTPTARTSARSAAGAALVSVDMGGNIEGAARERKGAPTSLRAGRYVATPMGAPAGRDETARVPRSPLPSEGLAVNAQRPHPARRAHRARL